jgi:hypothetical protein
MKNNMVPLLNLTSNKIFIISRNKSLKKEREKSVSIAFPQIGQVLGNCEFLWLQGPARLSTP